jgi:carbon-monoxide dehydrogenase medium subunit
MLTEVRIPRRAHSSSAYHKVERRAGDWAVVSSGAAVVMDDGAIADGRVGLAAVGPNTTGIDAVRDALAGQRPSEELFERVGAIAAEHCEPVSDQRGSEAYKRHLAKELTVRSLRVAVARATGRAGTEV